MTTSEQPAPIRRFPRRILVAAIAVVAFLVSGGVSYAAMSNHRSNQLAQDCGVFKCIPQLHPSTVVEALRQRGYDCDEWDYNCQVSIGAYTFKVSITESEDRIARISLEIFRLNRSELSEGAVAYLSWFAALPFHGDEVLSAQIAEWVAEQVKEGEGATAKIADFEYTFDSPLGGDRTTLIIEGR